MSRSVRRASIDEQETQTLGSEQQEADGSLAVYYVCTPQPLTLVPSSGLGYMPTRCLGPWMSTRMPIGRWYLGW